MGNIEREQTVDDDATRINKESIQTSRPEVLSNPATGPRTPSGKRRSKMNAVSHGIFTAGILKGVERKADFDKLVKELRDHFQTESPWEELLVGRMAMLIIRQRRVLISESAEIAKERSGEKQWREALEQEDRLNSKKSERGLMEFLDNPFVVGRCLELLTAWRERVHQRGYDAYFDFPLMRKLYGRCPAEELDAITQQQIRESSHPKKNDARSEQEKHDFREQQCKALLSKLDDDLEYLKHRQSVIDDLGRASKEYEKDSHLVPRVEILDRLSKYESHLGRELDRTENRLLRSIRTRLGHPPPPTLNVEIAQ